MKKYSEIFKTINSTLLIIGIIANITAIILIPKVGLCLLLVIFTVSFLVVFFKLFFISIRKKMFSIKHKDIPLLLIINKSIENQIPQKNFSIDEIKILSEIKLASLNLLFNDQLDTGGWSKSYFWRLIHSNQSITPVGSYTGTYFTIDSLFTSYGLSIPRMMIFKDCLESLLYRDGTYFRELTAISHGKVIKTENIRHSCGGFLIRSLFLETNQKDIMTIKWLIEEIQKSNFDHVEYLDFSFLLRAFTSAKYLIKSSEFKLLKSVENVSRQIFEYISDSIDDFDDIRLLWGPRKSSVAAGDTLFQWTVIWSLLPYLQECLRFGTQIQNVSKIISVIKQFIKINFDHRQNPTELLPAGYSFSQRRIPQGESVYSTAMAVIVLFYLDILERTKKISADIENKILDSLVKKLLNRGYSIATNDCLKLDKTRPEILEGYLGWAALIAVCQILGFKISDEEINWASNLQGDFKMNGVTHRDEFKKNVNEVKDVVNSLLENTVIRLDENGYYIVQKN